MSNTCNSLNVDEVVPKYESLLEYGAAILQTPDSDDKVRLTYEASALFKADKIPVGDQTNVPVVHDNPARPPVITVAPDQVVTKIKGDLLANRIRLIHSQAHIESYAIDLSWDILVRFAGVQVDKSDEANAKFPDLGLPVGECLPREFFLDWVQVAEDEARHYSMWAERLKELGSFYGALPTHAALWESATETQHSLLARLAVVHMVHEAHGLDCGQRMVRQMAGQGDAVSARYLQQIQEEEIGHVGAGLRWLRYVCERGVEGEEEKELKSIEVFHTLVRKHFRGAVRGPFNKEMRARAGMSEAWYEPLAVRVGGKAEKKEGKAEQGVEEEGKRRLDVGAVLAARKKRKEQEAEVKQQGDERQQQSPQPQQQQKEE